MESCWCWQLFTPNSLNSLPSVCVSLALMPWIIIQVFVSANHLWPVYILRATGSLSELWVLGFPADSQLHHLLRPAPFLFLKSQCSQELQVQVVCSFIPHNLRALLGRTLSDTNCPTRLLSKVWRRHRLLDVGTSLPSDHLDVGTI